MLSIMYLSGERIVPVVPGVCNIIHDMVVLLFDMILRTPTPVAKHLESLLPSYVVMGIGVVRRR